MTSAAPSQVAAQEVNAWYDRDMYGPLAHSYFSGSDFFNFGYWKPATATQREASENLVERLLEWIPEKRGKILDVACGKGATTRHLLRYYQPRQVTAINISEKQIETAERNAPGCTVRVMDATRLRFRQDSFDNIVCVEAACHFDTRAAFLREAYRVLKPGGRLVLSDLLLSWRMLSFGKSLTPANYVASLEEYKQLYLKIGFHPVLVRDETQRCWGGYLRHSTEHFRRQLGAGGRNPASAIGALEFNRLMLWNLRNYVLVGATKPRR